MEIVVRQSAVPGPTAMEAPLPDFLKMWLLQLLISSPVDRRLRTPRSLVPVGCDEGTRRADGGPGPGQLPQRYMRGGGRFAPAGPPRGS